MACSSAEEDHEDGEEDGTDIDGMHMEAEHEMHSGFMTTGESKGGTTTITFTVPEELVGE